VIKRLQNWLITHYRAEDARAAKQQAVLPIEAVA